MRPNRSVRKPRHTTFAILTIAACTCSCKPEWRSSLADTSPSIDCSRLRPLLRADAGGAVDIYEDDYAASIRTSASYAQFKHIPMDELVAIRAYSHRYWGSLNAALWKGTLNSASEIDQTIFHCATVGLLKLPPVEKTLYRRTNLPAAVLANHLPGRDVPYLAFTSTTVNPDVLKNFSGNVRFSIESAPARDIRWISEHPEEEEALIPACQYFTVLSREPEACDGSAPPPCVHVMMRWKSGMHECPGQD